MHSLNHMLTTASDRRRNNVIHKLKANETPGKDGFQAELFKCCPSSFTFSTNNTFSTNVWEKEIFPVNWSKAILLPILKKDGKTYCDNYRGISLLDTISIDIWPTSEHLLNQEAGQNLAVTCTTSSNKSNVQDIIWYKNGLENPIPSYGRIMASKVRHATTRLMLTGPKITDSGDYKCIVVLANEAINFENAPPEQHPTEGKDAKIICYVSGHPSIEIYWQFNGKNIIEGWPRGYEFKNKSQVLFIPKFKSAQDDGEYSCRATQFFSFKVRIINVTAYEPPQITVFEGSNQEYEGKDHKLMCQATGKPPPSYRWLKNTNGVETIIEQSQKYSVKNGLLVVKSLMPYDQGIYSCIASNALDTARFDHNLTIFRRPKIEMMKNETRSRGDLVELRCYFSGDGNITAKWIHNGEQWQAKTFDIAKYSAGGDLYAEDSRVFVRLEDGVSVLTIFSVQDDDAGQYQCVTENEAGTDQRSTYLAIIHAPTIIDRSDEIYVVNGGRAEMFCKAVAVPDPVWIWTGPENEIVDADGNLYIIDTISTTTKLIIEKVGETDFGNYKCTASNGIGDDNAQIDLHQIFIPNIPSEFHCDEIFPNYGICRIDDYVDMDRAHRPTHLNFIYEKDQEAKLDYGCRFPVLQISPEHNII
ncbi:unnamed protein product [Dracunculus medinensis]|uniref:Neuroglian n=1 Tax=Dracunculus medinensis TaxID=318479 RepID=A0A158Q588_DRAME|nr:unnamed protein product [Dracunculus medinensis]